MVSPISPDLSFVIGRTIAEAKGLDTAGLPVPRGFQEKPSTVDQISSWVKQNQSLVILGVGAIVLLMAVGGKGRR